MRTPTLVPSTVPCRGQVTFFARPKKVTKEMTPGFAAICSFAAWCPCAARPARRLRNSRTGIDTAHDIGRTSVRAKATVHAAHTMLAGYDPSSALTVDYVSFLRTRHSVRADLRCSAALTGSTTGLIAECDAERGRNRREGVIASPLLLPQMNADGRRQNPTEQQISLRPSPFTLHPSQLLLQSPATALGSRISA